MRNNVVRFTSLALLTFGIVLLAIVFLPIVIYQLNANHKYPKLISPLAKEENNDLFFDQIDYTKASNWFIGGLKSDEFKLSDSNNYLISIPKLKIKDAIV